MLTDKTKALMGIKIDGVDPAQSAMDLAKQIDTDFIKSERQGSLIAFYDNLQKIMDDRYKDEISRDLFDNYLDVSQSISKDINHILETLTNFKQACLNEANK